MKMYIGMCLFVLLSLNASAENIQVFTNDWEPYINPQGEDIGAAAEMLEVIGKYGDIDFEWQYVPYSDAQSLLKLGKSFVSFPYFFTEERAKDFVYSKSLYFANVRVFYNIQNLDSGDVAGGITSHKKGIVLGNSYGPVIDSKFENALIYESELKAIEALLSGDIDVLPMAVGVMNALLRKHFSAQEALVKPIEGSTLNSQLGMHVIAPKNNFGYELIKKIDTAIELRTRSQGEYRVAEKEAIVAVDLALLKPSEGYPTILGRSLAKEQRKCGAKTNADAYYTLPINTKVIVLQWSARVLTPSYTDRIYGNMMEESSVLIVNGPHTGKELCVKNMHVELL